MDTVSSSADGDAALAKALVILRSGGVIIYPTDTVYGVGGNATSLSIHKRVSTIKGRSPEKPFPWLVSSIEMAKRYGIFSPKLEEVVASKWPGATTFVVPAKSGGSVGLRVPKHPWLLELIEQFGSPIIGTSANRGGEMPMTSADADTIDADLLIDGGSCGGAASEVIDATTDTFKTLRAR